MVDNQPNKLAHCNMNGGTKLNLRTLIKCENQISTLQLTHAIPSHALKRDKAIMMKDYVILEEIIPPEYGTIADGNYNGNSFYRAIGPLITCIQFFGLMPLTGILGKDPTCLRFTWYSWKIVYTFFIMSLLGAISFAGFYNLIRKSYSITNFDSVVFYLSAFLTHLAFLRLAQNWPRVSLAIAKGEMKGTRQCQTLYVRFALYSFLILFFALVEHIMRIAASVSMVYMCDLGSPLDYKFYKSSFAQIFTYTDYAVWKGIILQVMYLVATFNWSLKDLFIILISVGLAQRFERLNESLKVNFGKHLPKQYWKVTRCEYAYLARLVTKVDKSINEIIMISFVNNLYSICFQLFNTLNTTQLEKHPKLPCWKLADGGLASAVYFVFSFSFLIIRFLAVALSASRVYSASRGPLKPLYSVPSETYCTEVRRFLDHVTTDTVGLTGLNFFYITRGLILTITGTVVTYELVLVQFNSPVRTVSANITFNDTCGMIPIINSTLTV